MNRRNGMWITVLCILAAGISATSITSNFVKESTGTSAIAVLAEMEAGGAQPSAPLEAPVPDASKRILTGPENRSLETGMPEETVPETPEPAAEAGKGSAGKLEESPAAVEHAAALAAAPAAVLETAAEESAGTAETVKSPLDPAPPENLETCKEQKVCTKEELEKRLEKAAQTEEQYQVHLKDKNPGAAYTAAEQLRALWDQELNLVYDSVMCRLTEEEAKELRIAELEWMKARDQAASMAAKEGKSPQEQALDSKKVLAEETRKRCIALMEEYGEVLERTP